MFQSAFFFQVQKCSIEILFKKKKRPVLNIPQYGQFLLFHSSLSNLYNNVIIYKIKKSRENSFVCERNVQNFPIHVNIRALYIDVSSYLTLTIQASSRLKRSLTTYGTTAMSVERNLVNDPHWKNFLQNNTGWFGLRC